MSARSILGLLYAVKSLNHQGVDLTPYFKQRGLSLSTIDANSLIGRAEELSLYLDASDQLQQTGLGLKIGQMFGLAGYGPFSLMLMTSPNALEASRLGVLYQEITYLFGTLDLKIEGNAVSLNIHPHVLPTDIKRFIIERDLAGMLQLLRDISSLIGQDLKVLEVHIPLPEPDTMMPYEEVLQCPVRFNTEYTSLIVENRNLTTLFPQANPMAAQLYQSQCDTLLKRQNEYKAQISDQVFQYLTLFNYHFPNIKQTSAHFGLAERSLRRHLAQADTSYQAILDQVKSRKANHWLMNTLLPIEEITTKLGYSEPAAFIHAYRRWHGMSPSQARKQGTT